ncbi:hypothetical protein [Acinetobacter shaoyimingii]|uniref:hypothetical protein n=1 Tax=Acinetobacter shaoyimingii TaxID=2715164 RepID=UPI0018C8AD38|nr:hypothetical protein [Acinetobacter shaoyimingii]
MKIKGLDHLSKQMKQLEKFMKEIDGSLGEVQFDPFDAESIEQAIINIENMIDQKSENYLNNPMISKIVGNLKENYRQNIIDKAAEARVNTDEDA